MWVGWVDIYGWMEMGRVSGGIFLIFCVGGHFLWKSEGGWGNEVYVGWGGVFTEHIYSTQHHKICCAVKYLIFFNIKDETISFCICVKRITLCNCLCSSPSSSSRSCFSASLIQNIREFRAKNYFTDHLTANTIHDFRESVPVLKIHGCY